LEVKEAIENKCTAFKESEADYAAHTLKHNTITKMAAEAAAALQAEVNQL